MMFNQNNCCYQLIGNSFFFIQYFFQHAIMRKKKMKNNLNFATFIFLSCHEQNTKKNENPLKIERSFANVFIDL